MNTITRQTRQMSFDDIQDKAKIRYIQILNRLDKPKTAKELAVELFELGFIPSTERNYTAPRLTELFPVEPESFSTPLIYTLTLPLLNATAT